VWQEKRGAELHSQVIFRWVLVRSAELQQDALFRPSRLLRAVLNGLSCAYGINY
jgi:hypothetical protein